MAKPIGRPPIPAAQKKRKINIAVDPEIFDFLETLPNRSEFMNKAAWILFRAYKKAETTGGQAARNRS